MTVGFLFFIELASLGVSLDVLLISSGRVRLLDPKIFSTLTMIRILFTVEEEHLVYHRQICRRIKKFSFLLYRRLVDQWRGKW